MIERLLYGTEENLNSFEELAPRRRSMFDAASDAPLNKEPNMNKLARLLHPERQYFVVKDIIHETYDINTYRLEPKEPKNLPAFFRAGQYMSFKLKIGDSYITRAYSLSSAPLEIFDGFCTVSVKRNQDGFASQYIHDNWKIGTEVETSGPQGHCYYSPVRDSKNVVGIAGGSGITPFRSMARDIVSGNSDFNLTLLYGCRTEKDIAFKDEFKELAKKSNGKIKVVVILSEEEKDGYEHGFIDKDIIRKYAPDDFTVFICGPQAMFEFVDRELEAFGLERKQIRRELFGQVADVYAIPGYPSQAIDTVYKLTLHVDGEIKILPAASKDSLLVTIERSGLKSNSCCRSGECGSCRGRLISGDVFTIEETNGVRQADRKHNIVHSCITYPLSDVEFEMI